MSLLRQPAFRPRIGGINAYVDDFGHLQTPLANGSETFLIPVWIGDDVDGNLNAKRVASLQRLEVPADRDPLAELAQAFIVDCLDTKKHIFKPDRLPEFEHILIA